MIKEDAPVTTTNNNGVGLTDPKLPIKNTDIFRRFKKMLDDRKSKKIK